MPVTIPNVIGGLSDAPAVNANFTSLKSYLDTNAILADGSVAFTATPSVASAALLPTADAHLVTKAYTDKRAPAFLQQAVNLSGSVSGTTQLTSTLGHLCTGVKTTHEITFSGTIAGTAGATQCGIAVYWGQSGNPFAGTIVWFHVFDTGSTASMRFPFEAQALVPQDLSGGPANMGVGIQIFSNTGVGTITLAAGVLSWLGYNDDLTVLP